MKPIELIKKRLHRSPKAFSSSALSPNHTTWLMGSGVTKVIPPTGIDRSYRFLIRTPDDDINHGAELAIGALWRGMIKKAGIWVPTVSGTSNYPAWIHPYDNYWINRVSSYFFPRESTEWPIRLFATYQSPIGEIGGGVYDIPEKDWITDWQDAEGPIKWQPYVARPIADLVMDFEKEPEKVRYGIYVREHLYILQVYDQWLTHGSMPFLIEMYASCRKGLKYLEKYHDLDHNGLIETTCILSDLPVAGDKDINSTERSEDQVLLYGALKAFSIMARLLGGEEDAIWADNWAAKIKTLINQFFWRPEGRFMFGMDRVTKLPKLEYMTTTYTNGYAILFSIAEGLQIPAILDFMKRQEFEVPGPYHIPPVRPEDKPQNPPGVYCNGGCGWGRGIMPSVALACYKQARADQGFDYLKRQAAAARKSGSFHEYWEWEKYTGRFKAGGASWYGETSSGFLDVILHGLFGITSLEPGYRALRIAPQFLVTWESAGIELQLPDGYRLGISYEKTVTTKKLRVGTFRDSTPNEPIDLAIELVLPWEAKSKPKVSGIGLLNPTLVESEGIWIGKADIRGAGELHLNIE
jgi:hypothetical protein